MYLNYILWNPDKEIFNLFGISLKYYGVLFMLGIYLGVKMLSSLYTKEGISLKHLEKLSFFGIIGIIIGARLGHCLFYEPQYYLSHLLEMFLPFRFNSDGGFEFTGFMGLASHGGGIGLIIAIMLYARKTKQSALKTLDLVAVVSGLSFAFIRVANFMNSEIVGHPTDKYWAVIFQQEDSLPRHPAQLYEAISYLVIFGIMLFFHKKFKNKLASGGLFGIAVIMFFSARFVIEFFKENQVAFENNMYLNMGQILSLPYILVGVIFFFFSMYRKKY